MIRELVRVHVTASHFLQVMNSLDKPDDAVAKMSLPPPLAPPTTAYGGGLAAPPAVPAPAPYGGYDDDDDGPVADDV